MTTCHFTAFQLNSSTNKMFNIMKNDFGPNFLITDKLVPADFFDTMLNSVTSTIE